MLYTEKDGLYRLISWTLNYGTAMWDIKLKYLDIKLYNLDPDYTA